MLARLQAANWKEPGAILVTQGQVEEQILDTVNTEFFQALLQSRTHAFELTEIWRGLGQVRENPGSGLVDHRDGVHLDLCAQGQGGYANRSPGWIRFTEAG